MYDEIFREIKMICIMKIKCDRLETRPVLDRFHDSSISGLDLPADKL